jgi:hypothetical protein
MKTVTVDAQNLWYILSMYENYLDNTDKLCPFQQDAYAIIQKMKQQIKDEENKR